MTRKVKIIFFKIRMSEAPFCPREMLIKQQQYFQTLNKHTYLKGRYDVITSVAIPLALAVSSGALIVSMHFL
jgi:Cytochrome c oxidase subunit VII